MANGIKCTIIVCNGLNKIENIGIGYTIEEVRLLLEQEKSISPSVKAMVELLILVISLLCNRIGLSKELMYFAYNESLKSLC